LIFSVSARKEGLSLKHFSKDAADTPHINCSGVIVGREKEFRSAVPSGGNVFSQDIGLHVMEEWASESKVTDLKVAVGVNK
jgi:hypothetical protein